MNIEKESFEFVDKFRIYKNERRLVSVKVAKQCALIAINEILSFTPIQSNIGMYYDLLRQKIEQL